MVEDTAEVLAAAVSAAVAVHEAVLVAAVHEAVLVAAVAVAHVEAAVARIGWIWAYLGRRLSGGRRRAGKRRREPAACASNPVTTGTENLPPSCVPTITKTKTSPRVLYCTGTQYSTGSSCL